MSLSGETLLYLRVINTEEQFKGFLALRNRCFKMFAELSSHLFGRSVKSAPIGLGVIGLSEGHNSPKPAGRLVTHHKTHKIQT